MGSQSPSDRQSAGFRPGPDPGAERGPVEEVADVERDAVVGVGPEESTEGTAAIETDIEFWNDIAVGLLTFLLGAYSTYEARKTDVAKPAAWT